MLSQAAAAVGGRLLGEDVLFTSVVRDSRQVTTGSLFLALAGTQVDGHAFVGEARRRGAAATLVEHEVDDPLPQWQVASVRAALTALAADWRARFSLPVIGLTGSNGKTTVKEMLASIGRCAGDVLATEGNLNNELGVPLTLLGLRPQHRLAVIEMGANHPGEIAVLAALTRPDVGLVNNAAAAHLAGFGSIDGVARAKGEMYAALSATATAILPVDEPHAALWRGLIGNRRCIEVALHDAAAAVHAEAIDLVNGEFCLCLPCGRYPVRLPLPGVHNLRNALMAAAAAHAAGCSAAAIVEGLRTVPPVPGRLQRLAGQHGATLIHDAYNANPGSLQAALDVLAAVPSPRWLVLGDMGEMGDDVVAWHRRAGELARQAGVDRVYALGEHSRQAVAAFGAAAVWHASAEALTEHLQHDLARGERPVVLFKASRFMRLERVVQAVLASVPDASGGQH